MTEKRAAIPETAQLQYLSGGIKTLKFTFIELSIKRI